MKKVLPLVAVLLVVSTGDAASTIGPVLAANNYKTQDSAASDGPESDINCSATPEAVFSYYFEICHDSRHMWWVNGACNKGVKEEMSELHKCATIDENGLEVGDRKFCHMCADGEGRRVTLCGADQENKEDACTLALSDDASNCGDLKITSYEHSCRARSNTKHIYNRKEFWCEELAVYPERDVYTCGTGWYFPFDNGEEVIFDPLNRYCLDCGPIGVCASDLEATCESLGVREPVPKNKGMYVLRNDEEPARESAPQELSNDDWQYPQLPQSTSKLSHEPKARSQEPVPKNKEKYEIRNNEEPAQESAPQEISNENLQDVQLSRSTNKLAHEPKTGSSGWNPFMDNLGTYEYTMRLVTTEAQQNIVVQYFNEMEEMLYRSMTEGE